MSRNVKGRLLKGFGAQGYAQLVNVFIQVVSVPLFIHYWGKVLYGEWLLLSTIPNYFNLSDLGFANAATNEMTMRVARGDKAGALRVFQSAWILVTALSIAIITVAIVAIMVLPIASWLKLSSLPHNVVVISSVLLLVQVLFALQRGVLFGGYQCDGNFATGTVIVNTMRLAEFLLGALVIYKRGGPIGLAATTLIIRMLENVVLSFDVRRRSPWISRGIGHADIRTMRELAGPALTFMGFPIGHALSLQGLLNVVGATLGPVAVVVFSASRTLTRFIWQILNTISNTVWVELSTAYGAGDLPLARGLHRGACKAALWLSCLGSLLLYLAGPLIFRIWTKGQLQFEPSLFALLLVVSISNSFWSTSYIVLLAVNRHQKLAVVYVTATALSLLLAHLLILKIGLGGAALSLLTIDIFMTAFVVARSLALLQDTVSGYVRFLLTPTLKVALPSPGQGSR